MAPVHRPRPALRVGQLNGERQPRVGDVVSVLVLQRHPQAARPVRRARAGHRQLRDGVFDAPVDEAVVGQGALRRLHALRGPVAPSPPIQKFVAGGIAARVVVGPDRQRRVQKHPRVDEVLRAVVAGLDGHRRGRTVRHQGRPRRAHVARLIAARARDRGAARFQEDADQVPRVDRVGERQRHRAPRHVHRRHVDRAVAGGHLELPRVGHRGIVERLAEGQRHRPPVGGHLRVEQLERQRAAGGEQAHRAHLAGHPAVVVGNPVEFVAPGPVVANGTHLRAEPVDHRTAAGVLHL